MLLVLSVTISIIRICRLERGIPLPLFWIAKRAGRPDWVAADVAKVNKGDLRHSDSIDRLLPLLLFWYDGNCDTDHKLKLEEPTRWYGRGRNPIVAMRSSFEDEKALYVAMKGGGPSISHSHMDAGSFVLDAGGVRWAVDLGSQHYHSLEIHGIKLSEFKQDSQRWTVFRVGPESHNIVRFNNSHQLVNGQGSFISFNEEGSTPSAVLNLNSLYSDQVDGMRRGLKMLDERAVLFQDEWDAGERTVEMSWQMLTRADVVETADGFLLTQDGQSLELRIQGRDEEVLECVDVDSLLQTYDEQNEGVKRIRIVCPPRTGQGRLRIVLIPGATEDMDLPAVSPLSEWS